jgi:hypothetical protein
VAGGVYSGNIGTVTIAGADADGTIYLDPVSSGSKTTWYSPHQVKFDIVDTGGVDTTGMIVNATYLDTSLPIAPTVSWLQDLYGITSDVAGDMVNNTLVMNATVGDDGSVVMTMHESIQYRVQVFDPATGTTKSINLFPKDSEYKLFITTETATASTLSQINGTRLTFYEPDMYHVTPGLEYQDSSGTTLYFNFSVRCMNNGTYVYWQNVSAPGTALRLVNTTFHNVRGEMYTWQYTATRS